MGKFQVSTDITTKRNEVSIDKVDLVMWAKNGESFLPTVLKRIDEVIPHENVCRKILIDDHSIDRTAEIAKSFNWKVYSNPKGGIPSGANEALRHVDCDFFISIEQDVVLAKDWWEKIPPFMNDASVVAAQGIRIYTETTLRRLEEYVYDRLKSSGDDPLRFWNSIDNNIFRTKVIKQIGGFPTNCLRYPDAMLARKIIYETPYTWILHLNVVSDHIRKGVRAYLKHDYISSKLCSSCPQKHYCDIYQNRPRFLTMLKHFLTSPIRALIIAYKTHCFEMLYMYPIIRYYNLMTCV